MVGTAHIDVNELIDTGWYPDPTTRAYPRVKEYGFPARPPVPGASGISDWKLCGNSEWVEHDIARKWKKLFHSHYVPDSLWVTEDAGDARTHNRANVFAYKKVVVPAHPAHDAVRGKWWVSNGKATTLQIDTAKMYLYWQY